MVTIYYLTKCEIQGCSDLSQLQAPEVDRKGSLKMNGKHRIFHQHLPSLRADHKNRCESMKKYPRQISYAVCK